MLEQKDLEMIAEIVDRAVEKRLEPIKEEILEMKDEISGMKEEI